MHNASICIAIAESCVVDPTEAFNVINLFLLYDTVIVHGLAMTRRWNVIGSGIEAGSLGYGGASGSLKVYSLLVQLRLLFNTLSIMANPQSDLSGRNNDDNLKHQQDVDPKSDYTSNLTLPHYSQAPQGLHAKLAIYFKNSSSTSQATQS